jgi:hypothetical protein
MSFLLSLVLGTVEFSQECAKASFPDICPISIQANKARKIIGVSFDLNDTVVKIGRVFNTRRNTRFMGKGDKMEQNNDVTLISPPTHKYFSCCMRIKEFWDKYA